MTSWTRVLRAFGAAAAAACLVLGGGSGHVVLANGIGDLYVADSAGIDEVYLKASTIEKPITDLPAVPSLLAFTPDGQTLYTASGSTDLYQIKISDLSHTGPTRTSAPVTALAHPFGSSLFVATEGSRTLSVLTDGGTSFADGPTLPSAPDLLAADPRETRFAAAARDGSWVAVVEPASSKVIAVGGSSGIGGKVVAMAVARAEGYVWVATASPNRIALVSLSTGKVASSAPLDAAPTAVAALGKFAVAATGDDLWKVQGSKASAWATAPGPVLGLAADLSAQFVYAAVSDKVVALAVAHPTASPAASVVLPKGPPTALAPVPNRGSSLSTSDSSGAAASAPSSQGGSSAKATTAPRKTHAPSTDTLGALATGRTPGMDPATLVLIVGGVVVAVVAGSRLLIKRLVGEP